MSNQVEVVAIKKGFITAFVMLVLNFLCLPICSQVKKLGLNLLMKITYFQNSKTQTLTTHIHE
nr:MAG TPA: hypothetical protein [Caudoviricetes sp.]